MPYIGNVLTSFAVETGNINDQAVTAPKLSATGGTDGQVLALDSNLNLEWVSDPAGQWVTSGSNIYYDDGNVGIGTTSPAQKLHISSIGDTIIRVTSADGNGAFLDLGDVSDPDGGRIVYDNGSNLTFSTGSTERLRIDSSGDVAIGNTSADGRLHVRKDGTGEIIQLWQSDLGTNNRNCQLKSPSSDSATEPFTFSTGNSFAVEIDSSEAFRIHSNGRVGIGVSSPTAQLEVQGAATSGAIAAHVKAGDGGSTVGLVVDGDSETGDVLLKARSNTGASPSDSDTKFLIQGDGNVGIGTTSPNRKLQIAGSTAITNSGDTGAFLFDPAGSVNTLLSRAGQSSTTALPLAVKMGNTERLRIDTSGNVGIGTSSPTSYGNSQVTLVIEDDTNPAICWSDTGQTRDWWAVANGSNLSFNYADGGGSGSASNVTTALSMTNSGSVGIGTTSPSFPSGTGLAIHHSTASRFKLTNDTTGTGASDGAHLYTSGSDFIIENKEAGNMRFYTNGGEKARFDTSGRLLIGSSSSRVNAGIQPKFQVEGTASDASLSLIRNTNNTANPYLLFAKSRGSSNGSNTLVQNGDYLGAIYFSGADGTDINSSGAEIHCRVDGTPGSNDMPGRLVFSTTADGASSPTERVRIDSSGNLQLRSGNQLRCQDASNHVSVQIGNIDSSSNSARISVDPDSTGSGSYLEVRVDNAEVYRAVNNFVRTSTLCNGLQFNGDTATTNALNDYEEGTWTPAFGSTTGSFTSVTYNIQSGNYTKIGNRVYFECRLRKTAHSLGTAGGGLLVTGLPYTVNSPTGIGGNLALSNINVPDNVVNLAIEMRENSSQFYASLYTRDNATFGNIGPGNLNQDSEIRASGMYYTNS